MESADATGDQGEDPQGAGAAFGDITVTARHKEESLKDVPLAISAFTDQKLKSLDLKNTAQIALFSPGLEFSGFSDGRADRGASRALTFRGLTLASNSGISAGALTFLDGAPVLGGNIDVSLDTERVEVLRGPQNVYFGRSTFSGAVNYVTRQIPKTWGGTVDVEGAEHGIYRLQASVGGPVFGEDYRLRITGLVDHADGQYRNDANLNERLGRQSTKEVSGTFQADFAPNFHAKVFANYSSNDDGVSAEGSVQPSSYNCSAAGPGTPINYYCGAIPKANHVSTWHNTALPQQFADWLFNPAAPSSDLNGGDFDPQMGLQRHSFNTSLKLDYELPGGIQIQEISAYHYDHVANTGEASLTNVAAVPNPIFRLFVYGYNQKFNDQSHELRFSSGQNQRFRWTVGGNIIKAKVLTQIVSIFQAGGQAEPATAPSFTSFQKTTTYGAFGGAYFDILDNVTVSGEARYQWDDSSTGGATRPQEVLSATFKSFQPRATLDWKITPSITTYVSYAAGARPGGFNADLLGRSPQFIDQVFQATGLSNTTYKQEKLDTFEFGVKGSLFDHRVSGGVTLYYGTLKDMQIVQPVNVQTDDGGVLGITPVANLGRVRIKGIEAEGAWKVTPRFTLSGTFALSDTEILKYPCVACVQYIGTADIKGNRLPLAPKYSGTLSADYTHPLSADWNAFAHVDYIYRGSKYFDFENLSKIGDTNLVNLRIGASTGHMTVEAFVTNLTNDLTATGGIRIGDIVVGQNDLRFGLPDRRTFGGRVRYTF